MQTQETKGSVFKAAILGAAAGATAVALTSKDTKKKIDAATKSLLRSAEKKIDEVKEDVASLKKEASRELRNIKIGK